MGRPLKSSLLRTNMKKQYNNGIFHCSIWTKEFRELSFVIQEQDHGLMNCVGFGIVLLFVSIHVGIFIPKY